MHLPTIYNRSLASKAFSLNIKETPIWENYIWMRVGETNEDVCVCLFSSEERQINGIAWEPKTLQVVSGHINKSMAELHPFTSCQLFHMKGLTVAKMGEHEQLSHQYGIKYLKTRKITYCSIYTACVKKFEKKPSQPKSSQRLSQNADRIFKYNSNLNNELRINRVVIWVLSAQSWDDQQIQAPRTKNLYSGITT